MSEHELAVPIEPEEHYTPQSIFDALRIKQFDLDPAHPGRDNPYCCVPARRIFTKADDGLRQPWPRGALTFMNPPFGGRRGQVPWLKKFFQHRNGIALVAARTSADWFHKVVVLIGMGEVACRALQQSKLGACYAPVRPLINHGRQADADEQVLERIEARILADHQEAIEADNFDAVCAARDRITAEGHGK